MADFDCIAIGCFVLGATMGAFLTIVALCQAPRGVEQDAASFRDGYRAGRASLFAHRLGDE